MGLFLMVRRRSVLRASVQGKELGQALLRIRIPGHLYISVQPAVPFFFHPRVVCLLMFLPRAWN